MVKKETRLGRGLGNLISSGITTTAKPSTRVTKTSNKNEKYKKSGGRSKKFKSPLLDEALVKDIASDSQLEFCELKITNIVANPYQPRRNVNEAYVKELADSIKSEGLLQPIVVRAKGKGSYELIAGERRWRACQLLKKEFIPSRVVDVTDSGSAIISLIENLQRENLNPVDEAVGYASLMKDFDLTQEKVSEHVSKPRASIANALRLLQLDKEIQGYVGKGMLSVGHAKVILGVEDPQQRLLLARRIIEEGMSVRQAEGLTKRLKATRHSGRSPYKKSVFMYDAIIRDLEKQMGSHLSALVKINHGAKKGKITIEYTGNNDLNRILERIGFLGLNKAAIV